MKIYWIFDHPEIKRISQENDPDLVWCGLQVLVQYADCVIRKGNTGTRDDLIPILEQVYFEEVIGLNKSVVSEDTDEPMYKPNLYNAFKDIINRLIHHVLPTLKHLITATYRWSGRGNVSVVDVIRQHNGMVIKIVLN